VPRGAPHRKFKRGNANPIFYLEEGRRVRLDDPRDHIIYAGKEPPPEYLRVIQEHLFPILEDERIGVAQVIRAFMDQMDQYQEQSPGGVVSVCTYYRGVLESVYHRHMAHPRQSPRIRVSLSPKRETRKHRPMNTQITRILPIEEEAFDLAIAGRTAFEIMTHLNATRLRDLPKALTKFDVEEMIAQESARRNQSLSSSLHHHFAMDLERMERLLAGLWTKASTGDPVAIRHVIDILKRKAAMLGLNAPEVRVNVGHQTQESSVNLEALSTDELRTYQKLLAKIETGNDKKQKAKSKQITTGEVIDATVESVRVDLSEVSSGRGRVSESRRRSFLLQPDTPTLRDQVGASQLMDKTEWAKSKGGK